MDIRILLLSTIWAVTQLTGKVNSYSRYFRRLRTYSLRTSYDDILYQTCQCKIADPWESIIRKIIDFNGLFYTNEELKRLNRRLCSDEGCYFPPPPTFPPTTTTTTTAAPPGVITPVTFSNPGIDGCSIYENSDGARCCTTCWTHTLNTTVYNPLNGETRYVVHMDWLNPPRYQYIPVGRCGYPGQCTGFCVQEYVTHYLLVAEADPSTNPTIPVFFEAVELPSYCKCTGATTFNAAVANLQEDTSSSSDSSSAPAASNPSLIGGTRSTSSNEGSPGGLGSSDLDMSSGSEVDFETVERSSELKKLRQGRRRTRID